ncbi:hypothetical protein LSH36_937g00000 [Paralvinella palmiformis]|uniref:Uncharacterized protein n=1 Tax=Paralvinella palmiformis TaxID=53620 RepID=A0AAD9IXV6_9ANNE|nr:hypothetical protein LSH36_937g00000 [Paralvinella palmiformis]
MVSFKANIHYNWALFTYYATYQLEPYLMLNPDYHYGNGQTRFVGFIPDLLREISLLTGMNYVIMTSPSNSFGYKQSDGSWDGMVGELMRQEADVAAAPMYRTSHRSKVVDFSIPFLDVHATLLLRKPPSGVPIKIRSVSDLINQSEVKYGTLDRGILVRAFKHTNSTVLKLIWRNMLRYRPSVFTTSNEDGIARVRQDNYAFILPHPIGEYMTMREPCDLVTIDKFLIDRGYCLALSKGSELLTHFNLAIRTLIDNGKMRDLYRTWWTARGQCDSIKPHKIYGSAYVVGSTAAQMALSVSVLIVCVLLSLPSYLVDGRLLSSVTS